MYTRSTLFNSVATTSVSSLILKQLTKLETMDISTLAHGDMALALAEAPIKFDEFEALKLGIDQRQLELIEEDGPNVDRALAKLEDIRIAVATQARQLSLASTEMYNDFFGDVDVTRMPDPSIVADSVGGGATHVSSDQIVHSLAE